MLSKFLSRIQRRSRQPQPRRRSSRFYLQQLEDRLTPSQFTPPYPITSGTLLQKVAFNESTALPAGQLSNGQVVAFYTDEHALLLGVNAVTVDKTATLPAKSTTITVNTASQGGTSSLVVGDSVVGSNIPTGTTITAVGSGSVTLSNATTNTAAVTETVAFTTAASDPNYQVNPTPSTVAGSASPVQVGAPYYTPAQLGDNAATVSALQLALDQAAKAPAGSGPGATDPSGRPNSPALFISDITSNQSATTGANDWQQGGATVAPSAVYGTWKTATETINLVNSSVSLSLANDPTANGTNLGGSPVAFPAGVSHEGYTAALVWNISDLENAGLVSPGHTYLFYVIDHDGDQNKTGGDSGQTGFKYGIPSLPTTANNVDVSTGAKLNDSATLPGSINPTGTVTFSLFAPGDPGTNPSTAVYTDTVTLTGAANPTINTSTMGNHAGGYDPTVTGQYHWVVNYSGDSNNQSASSPFGAPNENPVAEDANITIAPNTATNVVGAPHTFTVTVSEDSGSGFQPVANAPVTVTLTSSNGATPSPGGPFSGITDANGQFQVTFTSATPGQVVGHASTTFTDASGVTFNRSTGDGVGSDGGNATKFFEDEYITISPLSATNVVGAPHTVTATVFLNTGDGTGFHPFSGTPVTITLTDSNGASPNPGGPFTGNTNASGQFSVTFTSASAGKVVANATTSLTTGSTTITRSTGDSVGQDSSNATKFFEDEYITISPLSATNVVGAPHTVTATVFLNTGDGTGYHPFGGTPVTISLTASNGAAPTPGGPFTGSTDNNGQFSVTFTSASAGKVVANATTSLTTGSTTITRSTGDGYGQDSGNAVKFFEDEYITITPPMATDTVADPHTVTAHVFLDNGNGTGFHEVTGQQVTVTLTGKNGANPTPPGPFTGPSPFAVTFTSLTAGEVDANATTSLTTGSTTITRSTGDGYGQDSPNAIKVFEDEFITIAPNSATNAIGAPHTFTATVYLSTGTGPQPVPGQTVTITLIPSNGATPNPAGPFTGTTDANGQFSVTFTSATPGEVDGQASTTLDLTSIGGGKITRTTGDAHAGDSGNAVKVFEQSRILISPLQATNVIGTNHVLTAEVDISADGTHWTPEPNAPVTFSLLNNAAGATFVGPSSGNTNASGQVTATIVSSTAGGVDIQATTTFTISGVGGTFTSTTGTGLPNSPNAHKDYETMSTKDNPPQEQVGTGALNDTATLTGAHNPGGTITFQLFAPLGLGGGVVYTDVVPVSGNGTYTTFSPGDANFPAGANPGGPGGNDGGFVPTQASPLNQFYQWKTSYSGDGSNPAMAQESNFNTPNENVTVTQAPPTLSTEICPSPGVVVSTNTAMKDEATLSGAFNATGTITFYLFAPGVTPNSANFAITAPTNFVYKTAVTLTGTPGAITVNTGMGNNPTDGFVPTTVGTYNWVASYGGDINNSSSQSALEPDIGFAQAPAPPYPLTTTGATPLQKVAFNESSALAGFRFYPATATAPAHVGVFYTDEHSLLLGVNAVTVDKTATLPPLSNTITVNTASQGATASLLVGDAVVGSNIPTGTTITAVGSGSVTLSNKTTNTASVTETVAFTTAASNPNYQVSPFVPNPTTHAGGASPVTVGAPYYTPAQLGLSATTVTPLQLALAQASKAPAGSGPGATDPSGRPNFPAGFVSDITGLGAPATGANDWQNGGYAQNPSSVYGSWKPASETINLVTSAVTLALASDPTTNGKNLAGGDTWPTTFTSLGYTAEAVFNLSDLKVINPDGTVSQMPLIEGHTYRLYMIDHDGDQNKTGGDSGQAAFDFTVPCTDELTAAGTPAAQSLAANPPGFGRVVPGLYRVAVDGLSGAMAQAEQARISDAIASLNAALGSSGVKLVQVASGAAADIHLSVTNTTSAGGISQGVLGAMEFWRNVTLVSGWNWYTGSDPSQIGPDQYDFQTIVAHELGHAFGINESPDSTSVMYGILGPGQVRRDLSVGDLTMIRQEMATTPNAAYPFSDAPVQTFANPLGNQDDDDDDMPAPAASQARVVLASLPVTVTGDELASTDSATAVPADKGGDAFVAVMVSSHDRASVNVAQAGAASAVLAIGSGLPGVVSPIPLTLASTLSARFASPDAMAIEGVMDRLFRADESDILPFDLFNVQPALTPSPLSGSGAAMSPAVQTTPADAVWQSFAADEDLVGVMDSTPMEFMPAEVAPANPAAADIGPAAASLVEKAPVSDAGSGQSAWAWAAFLGGLGGIALHERRRKSTQG
jgi:hypothetical protein